MRGVHLPLSVKRTVIHGRPAVLVTDILGRTKGAKTFPGGEYECPFCHYPVFPERGQTGCQNPACSAFHDRPLRMAEGWRVHEKEMDEKRAKQRAEEASHEEIKRFRESYAQERRTEERRRTQEIEAEAIAKGACPRCALESARYGRKPKFTKHRKACPLR